MIVVWEHVTPSDRNITEPSSRVLSRVADPRVTQFWDSSRIVSYLMVRDLPHAALSSVADIDTVSSPVAWDCLALFPPGVRWEDKFPAPLWAGRPVADVIDAFAQRLAALEDSTRIRRSR